MVVISSSHLRLLLLCTREGKSSARDWRCGQRLAIRSHGVLGIPGPRSGTWGTRHLLLMEIYAIRHPTTSKAAPFSISELSVFDARLDI
jgi:hypothetical protein